MRLRPASPFLMGAVSLATAPEFVRASAIAAATILGADDGTGLRARPPPPFTEGFFFASLRGELSSPPVTPLSCCRARAAAIVAFLLGADGAVRVTGRTRHRAVFAIAAAA